MTARGTLPGATDVSLASAGGGFLAAYETTNGAGNLDVRARRLSSTGVPVGTAVTVAGGAGDQFDPVAAGSGSAYLVAWRFTGNGPDLGLRTIQSGGALGTSRVLASAGEQFQPSLAGGGAGSWFAAWSEVVGDDTDVVGSKVLPSGAPVSSSGNTLVGGPGDQSAAQVTRAAGNTAFFTWFEGTAGIDLTRKLDADGFPFGPTIRSTRSPFAQACFDVAAGDGQYLVTWQESRVVGTNLYAQRYLPNGTPTGARITLSTAPRGPVLPDRGVERDHLVGRLDRWPIGHQGRVRRARLGRRCGHPDRRVPDLGRPEPAAVPVGRMERHGFVLAWNDLRNGNQDIFVARVAPNRTVRRSQRDPGHDRGRDPAEAERGQRRRRHPHQLDVHHPGAAPHPPGQRHVPRRHRRRGPLRRAVRPATAVASPTRMGVLFEHENRRRRRAQVVLANINPANGAKQGLTVLESSISEQRWIGGDLSFDGTSFAYTSGPFFTETLRRRTSAPSPATPCSPRRAVTSSSAGAPIASLPDQRSLIVDSINGRIAVAPVDDAP